MSEYSLWERFVSVLRDMKIGDTITKEQLTDKIAKTGNNARTIERYKSYLTKEGYLSVIDDCLYRKEKTISFVPKNAFAKRSKRLRFIPKVNPR